MKKKILCIILTALALTATGCANANTAINVSSDKESGTKQVGIGQLRSIDDSYLYYDTNPYGRRHIMSLWQEDDFKESDGLMPCAFLTIWNVRGEYLDMMLVQRSGDMLTASGAGGINEVQYAALQMMIAKATGYKPGMFTHVVANEQIYDRHMEQANELLARADVQLKIREDKSSFCYYDIQDTRLEFNPKSDDFYSFTIDDFTMRNYEPIKPQLTFDLGI